jgi:hypothetical protein
VYIVYQERGRGWKSMTLRKQKDTDCPVREEHSEHYLAL